MTEKRGRKALKAPVQPEVQINEEAIADAVKARDDMHRLKSAYTSERDTLNQLIGRIQMGRAIGGLTNALNLQALKSVKESKIYKSLAGQSGVDRRGLPIHDLGTWEGFCRAVGFSPDKLDEDLKNLDAFGEEALESLSAVGAGYRELRQYRKLPEDRKQALIEVAKAGDKEGFVELAEEIIAKHAKEKEDFIQRLQEANQTLQAKDSVLTGNAQKINELAEQLELSKKFKPRPHSAAQSQEEQNIMDELDRVSASSRIEMRRLFLAVDAAMNVAGEAPPLKARQVIEFMCQELADNAIEFGIAISLNGQRVNPPWFEGLDPADIDKLADCNAKTWQGR